MSIIVTIGGGVLLALLAWASTRHNWLLWLAASVGGQGGLVHEIAQSGRRIVFFKQEKGGLYLGSLAGAVLGAVDGILVIRGHLNSLSPDVNTLPRWARAEGRHRGGSG